MEILQTIWNTLTNENETVMNIITIPLSIIEIYLYMLIFLTFFNITYNNKQKIIFVGSFTLISLLNNFLINNIIYTFINVLAIPVLVFFIFKTGILKSILSEILVYAIALLLGTFLIAIYSKILNVSSYVTVNIPIHKILYSMFFYICLYILYVIFKRKKINILILDKYKRNVSLSLLLNFFIGSVAIGIDAYLLFKYIDFIPNILIFSNISVLLIYFIISMYSLIRTNKLEITTQHLEEQKMYNKTLNILHDNIRGFKHDFNNIVQAIGGYLSTNNIDGLKIYYNDLLTECQINNNLAVLNPEIINNPAIYSLLADKYYKAEKGSIKLNLEVFADLSNIKIKTFELTRILGILLDNALEAAAQCENKIVNVTFKNNRSHNGLLIIIQNTYINKEINLDRIFEKGYTSKQENKCEENHGLGLWEVRKYLKKNSNLDLYTKKDEKLFTQQFEIFD